METGLFEIEAGQLRGYRGNPQLLPDSRDVIHAVFRRPEPGTAAPVDSAVKDIEQGADYRMNAAANPVELACCFLRLANPTLWRQVGRILYALEALDRRKPQERRRMMWPVGPQTEGA
jgi:hypothetical protein